MSDIIKHEEGSNAPLQQGPQVDPWVALIDKALSSDVDFSKLEKMLDMQERMQNRQAEAAFAEAVAAAKGEIPEIIKDKLVDFGEGKDRTTYMHEGFDTIAKAVDPILARHGLSYRFASSQGDGGYITVTCILQHRLGGKSETPLGASPDSSGRKGNLQAIGSTITYLQRYTLKLALGIGATMDDDGMGALPDNDRKITGEQFMNLKALMEQARMTEPQLLARAKIQSLEAMPLHKYGAAVALLERAKQKSDRAPA